MYYLPDHTKRCGFYECTCCGNRFLSLQTRTWVNCPACEREIDPEIGPDEVLPEEKPTAKLLQICEGEEEVEKLDTLLSLAVTGGDDSWI